jgi:hypothetical protein
MKADLIQERKSFVLNLKADIDKKIEGVTKPDS